MAHDFTLVLSPIWSPTHAPVYSPEGLEETRQLFLGTRLWRGFRFPLLGPVHGSFRPRQANTYFFPALRAFRAAGESDCRAARYTVILSNPEKSKKKTYNAGMHPVCFAGPGTDSNTFTGPRVSRVHTAAAAAPQQGLVSCALGSVLAATITHGSHPSVTVSLSWYIHTQGRTYVLRAAHTFSGPFPH